MVKARNWQKSLPLKGRQKITPCFFVASIIVTVSFFFAVFFTWSDNKLLNRVPYQSDIIPRNSAEFDNLNGEAKKMIELPSERSFKSTLKSCLNSGLVGAEKKCFEHIPNGSRGQRIVILSPPGELHDTFVSLLRNGLDEFNEKKGGQIVDNSIELIQTSHVPPYGYGKNHGWTKIIRLANLPLLNQVFDTENYYKNRNIVENGIKTNEVVKNLLSTERIDFVESDDTVISEMLRQTVRWHCRLSHVAAHTALFTVDFTNPEMSSMKELIEFIVSDPSSSNEDYEEREIRENELILNIAQSIEKKMKSSLFKVTERVKNTMTQKQFDALEDVLADELKYTNNLSAWPCLSFWDFADTMANTDDKYFLLYEFAKALSPNCSASFTKCSIQKDKCEEEHRAHCK